MSLVINTSSETFTIGTPLPTVEQAALAGARICRYSGRTRCFWSDLVHSFCVMDLLDSPVDKFYAAIHDVASETVVGDILHGIKVDSLKELESQIYARVLKKWGIPLPTDEIKSRVHIADRLAYSGECRLVAPVGHTIRRTNISRKAERLTRHYMKMACRPSRESLEVKEFLKRYYALKELL
jgi:hypothetical protein